jgi:integrase
LGQEDLIMRLTAKRVDHLHKPGRHGDGGGLYLQITPTGVRSWVLRYERAGRERMLGLGPVRDFSLKEARERARRARQQLHDGIDPIAARRSQRTVPTLTFAQATETYAKLHAAKWTSRRPQFLSSLRQHAFPVLGDLPLPVIGTPEVLKVLEPLWTVKTETGSRLRGRIEAVLDWATISGHRQGANPARWKGHLAMILPAPSAISRVRHHPALAWSEIASFMGELRSREGVAARALEFTILTAARTNEVIGATWSEIDFDAATWTIPAERMKADKEHRVPVAPAALELLRNLYTEGGNDLVFIGSRAGRGLGERALAEVLRCMRSDITVHGFRSTFRDWASECTNFPSEVAEMALAHAIPSGVERAYRRGDLFAKRRALMTDWAAFCAGGVS